MLRQWPGLRIQARTAAAGVRNPAAMFSPAWDQSKPAAVMRAAKLAPWVKLPARTIVFVHPWAERFRRLFSCSGGSPRAVRWTLMRQTTAACSTGR